MAGWSRGCLGICLDCQRYSGNSSGLPGHELPSGRLYRLGYLLQPIHGGLGRPKSASVYHGNRASRRLLRRIWLRSETKGCV